MIALPIGKVIFTGGSVSYQFAAGSLAGEIERLTASGDYTLTVNGQSLPVEYIQIDTDQVYSTNTSLGSVTPDTRMVCVKVKGNLTVNSGVTVTTTDRKLGLVFYVTGAVQIDGTIDMSARGGNHSAAGSNLAEFDLQVIAGIGVDGVVPGAGGSSMAAPGSNGHGNTGNAGASGGSGGGGTGGTRSFVGGSGAAGTSWSSGPGGGGSHSSVGGNGVTRGGAGGDGGTGSSGGGAGNPGGALGGTGSVGGTGTAGLIILIVLGAITIGATGIMRANGNNGGNALSGGAGGGASGGGSVNLYRRGAYTNSGTVQTNGGTGGTSSGVGKFGGAGGAGSVRSVPFSVVTQDADADILFGAMSTQPDATRKLLIARTIDMLKTAGVWTLLDELWVPAAHDSQAALLGWKRYKDLVAVNAPTFTTDRGYAGNGSTSYLNTQFVPSTHGVNFALNDASVGIYNHTNSAVDVEDMGANNATTTNLVEVATRGADGNYYGAINQSTTTGRTLVANADARGLYVVRRTASNAIQAYKNGSEADTDTRVSVARPSVALYIGARNNNGAAAGFSAREYAMAFVAASLSAQQQADFYTITQAYMTAIGAQV